MARLVGVLPALRREGAIGGAPPALLPTGDPVERTFLGRALSRLRAAGVEQVVALVRHRGDPVAMAALREGCHLLVPEGGATEGDAGGADGVRERNAPGHPAEGEVALRASLATLPGLFPAPVSPDKGPEAGAGEEAEPFPLLALLLPPSLALVEPATLAALVEGAGRHPEARAWIAVQGREGEAEPVQAPDPGGLRPRLLRILPEAGPDLPTLLLPLPDPHLATPILTLPAYRRHFPQAARRRFQKW